MKRINYRWQDIAIYLCSRLKAFALSVECGCGKTLAAIRIAFVKNLPVLVITPNRLMDQWHDEILSCGEDEKNVWVHRAPEKKDAVEQQEYYSKLRSWINGGNNGREE